MFTEANEYLHSEFVLETLWHAQFYSFLAVRGVRCFRVYSHERRPLSTSSRDIHVALLSGPVFATVKGQLRPRPKHRVLREALKTDDLIGSGQGARLATGHFKQCGLHLFVRGLLSSGVNSSLHIHAQDTHQCMKAMPELAVGYNDVSGKITKTEFFYENCSCKSKAAIACPLERNGCVWRHRLKDRLLKQFHAIIFMETKGIPVQCVLRFIIILIKIQCKLTMQRPNGHCGA